MSHLFSLLCAALLLLAASGCDDGSATPDSTLAGASQPDLPPCEADDGGITLPDGFCAAVVADGLGRGARHLAVRDNGDLYVILLRPQRGGAIIALRDTTGDGYPDVEERFGEAGGTGIAVRDGYLYASTDQSVRRYRLDDDALVPRSRPETIVEGFPEQSSHEAKPFTFDDAGHLYVNVGAPSNACQDPQRTPGAPGQDPCPELERQGGIWRFQADEPGQTQQQDGRRYGTGIRNAVALDWDANTGALYAVQHGRDQLSQLWPDLYTEEQNAELPAEEFVRVEEGDDFGWPYCYYDQMQEQKVLAPEYGGDGEEVGRCATFKDPLVGFPGHWAPNDVLFYNDDLFPERYRGGAFIAFHGSWNRAPLEQGGYNVVFVPFAGGSPLEEEWEVFADGFANAEFIEGPGDAAHRPMGLAVGPDGALYISDSVQGRIWRVIPDGDRGATSRAQPGR